MAMLLYPLELIRPSNPAKVYTVLFAPLLIVVIAGLFGGIGYTYIDSLSDLWHNIGKPDVWFRIVVPSGNDRASEPAEADTLWDNIIAVIETEHRWSDPDLTLTSLTSKVGSNRTYVSNSFRHNAGVGFSEYISRRRVGHVVEVLDNDPEADVQSLFFYVGYRSYSTAWDNFRRVTGMTVGEYVGKLKS